MNDPEEDRFKPNPDYIAIENPTGLMAIWKDGKIVGWQEFELKKPPFEGMFLIRYAEENNDHQS